MSQDEYEFPFEYWANLAADDPQSFEEARQLMIDSLIESAPEPQQTRLRGLQWQIDQVRARTPNPMGACVKISGMMWQKVLGPNGLVEHLEALGNGESVPREAPRGAKIIPLRRPD
jgi:hypothetical protein